MTVFILACAPLAAAAQPPATLPYGDDLAAAGREARARRVPVMLVFTEATCNFCIRAKRYHIVPLAASRDYGDKMLVREVDLKRDVHMKDFSGSVTTPAEFARRYSVQVVPTVVMVDTKGRRLADPVAGLLIEDFYQAYLERAVDSARAELAKAR